VVSITRPTSAAPVVRAFLAALLLLPALIAPPAWAELTRADVEVAFPTFGVTLTGPFGWVHLPGGSAGMISRWGKIDPRTTEVLAMVTAEVEPLEAMSLPQYAMNVAQRMGGKIEREKVDLNGVKAIRVSPGQSDAAGLRPSTAFVATKGKYVYVVASFESKGAPAADGLESVRRAWRWLPIEPVVKHLQQQSPPFPAAGLTLRVPAIARPFAVKDARTQSHLAVFDYVAGVPTLDIEVVAISIPGDVSPVMEQINRTLAQQLNMANPLTWKDYGGQPRRWVSSSFDKTAPNPVRGKPPTVTVARYAIVQTSDRQGALLTLQYVLGAANQRATFEEANEAIVRSIGPAEAGAAESGGGSGGAVATGPRGDGSIQITRKAPKRDKSPKP
jgi:hypothetical protein